MEKIDYDIEKFENGAHRVAGFPVKPRLDYIFVLDYGQPNQTQSGIYLGETPGQYEIYRHEMYRYGEVIAFGPGRFGKRKGMGEGKGGPPRWWAQSADIQIGTIVLFSRKTGTRLPSKWDFESPRYPDKGPIHVRIFDPDQIIGVADEDWQPWWDIQERQLNVSGTMTG